MRFKGADAPPYGASRAFAMLQWFVQLTKSH